MEKNVKNQWLFWLGCLVLILVEYGIFHTYISREIIPFYPKSYDQTVYLAESYKLYEKMLARGRIFAVLMRHDFLSQTLLFHVQAALVFLVFGASRLVALSINFFYFLVLQLAAIGAIKSITGRYRYGLVFVGMLLAANSLVMANDFRIDFMGSCLYGILCFAILKSDVFLSRKWTAISAAIAIFLIMMRYITICYVLGMLGVLGAYYASLFLISKKNKQESIRLLDLFLYGACLLIIIVPMVCLNWNMIYNYYIVGHLTGGEKLMRLQVALQAIDFSSAYLFYPIMFFKAHVSIRTVLQLGLILTLYAIQVFLLRKKAKVGIAKTIDYQNIFIFLATSLLVPLIILSLDESKSILVINVILVPFIALLLFAFVYFSEKVWIKAPVRASKGLNIVTAFFLVAGIYNYVVHHSKESHHSLSNDKDYVVTQMTDDIGNYANFLNWKKVNLSSDYLADYLNAPLSSFYYERHGIYFDVNTLPLGNNGMTKISKKEALNSLEHSDIYTVNLTHYKPDPVFPFESSIQSFRAALQKIATKNMISLGEYFIFNNVFRVYARPDVRIEGIVDHQITDNGIWLDVPAPVAQQIKIIELTGESDFNWLTREKLQMYVRGAKGQLKIIKNHYQITCELPNAYTDKPLRIHLTFSRHNTDNIVMSAPTQIRFFKAS